MTIDSHQHFWKYDPVEYDWIDDERSVIRRDFLPGDLRREIEGAGIDRVVAVQARQTVEETRWLVSLAEENEFIAAVVGWLPLVSPEIEHVLNLARHPKLRGVRHVLQGEANEYMAREDFNRGIAALRAHELAYDILIYERQLPAAIGLVDRHPEQTFIVDHAAKPRIRDGVMEPWRENLRELSRRGNVWCKVSGMVTEADYRAWSEGEIRRYFDVVIEAFGPQRVMFGSDWPVCLVACGYRRWATLVREFIALLSTSEQADVMGGTARRAYGIK